MNEEPSMARRLLESLTGIGGVYAGDLLLRTTPYQLSLWLDEDLPAPGGASSREDSPANPAGAATVSIEGHIDITGIAEAVVLAGSESLTLRLQDGRWLMFSLTGTGGGIVGRGGLQPARA
jgi:hypothetical protein